MSISEDILRLSADESLPISRNWLDHAMHEQPYNTLPIMLYLKRNGIEGNEDLLARLAIASPDRQALAMQLGEDVNTLAQFYPPEPDPVTPDTDTTIDRFLDSYGHSSDKEIEALMGAIFNPTPDYADVLAAQERAEHQGRPTTQTEEDRLINQFIAENQERERQVAQAPSQAHVEVEDASEVADVQIDDPSTPDDTMFSESLAMSYIAGHKFDLALEIIENISARNPEKSIYFADQIRFLRKLVVNEKLLNNQ